MYKRKVSMSQLLNNKELLNRTSDLLLDLRMGVEGGRLSTRVNE